MAYKQKKFIKTSYFGESAEVWREINKEGQIKKKGETRFYRKRK